MSRVLIDTGVILLTSAAALMVQPSLRRELPTTLVNIRPLTVTQGSTYRVDSGHCNHGHLGGPGAGFAGVPLCPVQERSLQLCAHKIRRPRYPIIPRRSLSDRTRDLRSQHGRFPIHKLQFTIPGRFPSCNRVPVLPVSTTDTTARLQLNCRV